MIYDEFESEKIDISKKKQYHKCSRRCGARALYELNRELYMYIGDPKDRLAHRIYYRTSIDAYNRDNANYIKVLKTRNINLLVREKGMSTKNKYICVYRGIDDRIATKDDLKMLETLFRDLTSVENTYRSALKYGLVQDSLQYTKLVGLIQTSIDKYLEGEYRELKSLEEIDQLGYNFQTKQRLNEELDDIENIDKYFNGGKSKVILIDVYLKDILESSNGMKLRDSLEELKTMIDYYYDRPKAYMYYRVAKMYGEDYTKYVDKVEEDGEYVYSVKEGAEWLGNELLERYLQDKGGHDNLDNNKLDIIKQFLNVCLNYEYMD